MSHKQLIKCPIYLETHMLISKKSEKIKGDNYDVGVIKYGMY